MTKCINHNFMWELCLKTFCGFYFSVGFVGNWELFYFYGNYLENKHSPKLHIADSLQDPFVGNTIVQVINFIMLFWIYNFILSKSSEYLEKNLKYIYFLKLLIYLSKMSIEGKLQILKFSPKFLKIMHTFEIKWVVLKNKIWLIINMK